jgi:hypothetical protein
VAVSLSVVLLILDVYPLRRLGGGPGRWFGAGARRVWGEKVPFIALSLVFMRLALLGRHSEKNLASLQDWGFAARITQSCYAIWFYVVKTVLPLNIRGYYPLPERVVLMSPPFLSSILGTLGVSVAVFLLRRWRSG